MADNTSIADQVTDFQRLLQSVSTTQSSLPDITEPQEALQGTVNEMTTIMSRQDAHRAGLRADSKRLRVLLVQGADSARQIRSLIRGHLGPRNEKLVEFRIKVLGRNKALPPPPAEPPRPRWKHRRLTK